MSITRGLAIDTSYKIMGNWIETTNELKFLGIVLDNRTKRITEMWEELNISCFKKRGKSLGKKWLLKAKENRKNSGSIKERSTSMALTRTFHHIESYQLK